MRAALCVVVFGGFTLSPAKSWADRYEVQWSARPLIGVAQMRDEWTSDYAAAPAAGMSLAVSYGVTNSLDLGVEALSFSTLAPTFEGAAVRTNGYTANGPYERRSDSVGGTVNATWRLGVVWVPIINMGVGRGVRYRSAGVFTRYPVDFSPMQTHAERVEDWLWTARSGVEYRMTPRWTFGGYGTLLLAWSPDAPTLPAASLSFGVSYVFYPNL
ncbi:MAG: hypothetical protein IPI49_19520 [Myxococcales bacterium]|nr:hypothetical protein [Myxococcales bacterium]